MQKAVITKWATDPGAPEQWGFTIKGGNGETQATSEGYTTLESAKRGANDLIEGIAIEVDVR